MKKILIVGSGNVAHHLSIALKNSGFEISQIFSRNLITAEKLASIIGCDFTNEIEKVQDYDLALLCIKDDEIHNVANQFNKRPIVHTSGSSGLSVFKNQKNLTGIVYPLQTFNKNTEININEVPFFIVSNDIVFKKELKKIFSKISEKTEIIANNRLKRIHLAAVFACNFSTEMYSIAQEILRAENSDFENLKPLIYQNFKKIENEKIKTLRTGPAKRKDFTIINRHLKTIRDPRLKKIYQAISDYITQND